MKALKFNHRLAGLIAGGRKNTTWRLFDDKDLSVGDAIKIIDKVDAEDTKTWRIIGQGSIKQIVEKKLGDVTTADMEEAGEVFASKEALLDTYRGYYGNRVSFDTPVKFITFDFAPSSGEAPAPAMLLEEARVYTDGGSRGNPGKSACGFVICDLKDQVVEKAGFYLGIATNNQAEYYGFLKALQRAKELGISRIQLFSDSQLVVNQMKGIYKIKNPELAPIYQDVKLVADSFERIAFTHVPREFNTLADQEVNKILDAQENQNRPAPFRGT